MKRKRRSPRQLWNALLSVNNTPFVVGFDVAVPVNYGMLSYTYTYFLAGDPIEPVAVPVNYRMLSYLKHSKKGLTRKIYIPNRSIKKL